MGRMNKPGPAAERAEDGENQPNAAKRLSLRALALWVLVWLLLAVAAAAWVVGPMICMFMRGCGE